MHNFVYLAQRRSQEFSCEPNFGGRAPRPSPWLRHCALVPYCPRKHLSQCQLFCRYLNNLHRQKYSINNMIPSDVKYKQRMQCE